MPRAPASCRCCGGWGRASRSSRRSPAAANRWPRCASRGASCTAPTCTVVENLRALGVQAEELPDGLVVHGTRAPLRGSVATRGDHRIAMAFGVLGATQGAAVAIDDPSCVDVSFPGFWDLLRQVASA
ncbi:MAG: hypothetical protein B7Z72_15065 [Gemmatimonadetes bacterium 21-71-4]|nr:MAG: hypothetical protein B7Z72_15065 [Gemmatimonadetes bacterium 21-71-4]